MASAERVVSLLPSETEIVAGLGCAGRLVGRSHECDYPSGVESLPVCTRPRIELGGSSAEIDASVRDAVKDAVAIYEVLEDRLRSLAPDVIVTQSQCEVCAVSFEEVEAAVASWSGREVAIVSLESRTLAGVHKAITRVAEVLGGSGAGHAPVKTMTEGATAVRDPHRAWQASAAGCPVLGGGWGMHARTVALGGKPPGRLADAVVIGPRPGRSGRAVDLGRMRTFLTLGGKVAATIGAGGPVARARSAACRAGGAPARTCTQLCGAGGITLEGPGRPATRGIRQLASQPPGEAGACETLLEELDL